MNRAIIRSTAFTRAAKRLVKKQPHLAEVLRGTLGILADDAFDPRLKSHKLKGDLAGRWACSAGYDLRIIFVIVPDGESEAIRLLTIGTHDEVY